MNQHDEQHGHEQGDASVDRAQSGPVEHGGRDEQPTTGATVPGPVDEGERSATAIPPTGDDRVDAALSRLGELDRLDVTEHAGVVEDVHRALQDTLAEEED